MPSTNKIPASLRRTALPLVSVIQVADMNFAEAEVFGEYLRLAVLALSGNATEEDIKILKECKAECRGRGLL